MPQMMPCSWLVVFLGSVVVFLLVSSSWWNFFFLSRFPTKNLDYSRKESGLWFK